MSKLPMRNWPRFSRGQVVAVAAVLAVTSAILLTTFAARSPASATRPQVSAAIASSSTTAVPVTASSAAIGRIDTLAAGSSSAPATGESDTAHSSSSVMEVTSAVPVQVSTPDPTVAPAPAPARSSVESLITGRAMYATDTVNLRDAPGTDNTTVIVVLNSGQLVTAGDAVNGWVPVHAGDIYGWVSSDYLADGTPAPQAPAAPPPADGSTSNWMTDLIPQVDPSGAANWEFWRNGSWGATDGHTVYIDPNVPSSKRFSVMVHEYSHVLQVQVYGSLSESVARMNVLTGGNRSDVTANESTADCMALMLGATWVNYGCQDSLRDAATAILAGHRP